MNARQSAQDRHPVIRKVGLIGGATISLLLVAVPLLWPLSTSLKAERAIYHPQLRLIPTDPTFQNYRRVVNEGAGQAMLNSTIVAAGAVLLAIAVGALAGYGMSRFQFIGQKSIQAGLAASLALPAISIVVPLQFIMLWIGLLGTRFGLMLTYAGMTAPFVIWVFQAHFDSVPRELERAAHVDGYGRLATAWHVLVPGLRPAVLTAGVFVLLAAWNDFIVATSLVSSPAKRTIQVGLMFYQGTGGKEWGPLMAGVFLAILPPLLFFVAFRKLLMRGLARGALKG